MNETNRPQDKLRDKANETRGNIADIGHLAKETAQNKFGELREAVQDKFGEVKEQATDAYDEGKEKLHEMEESLVRKVRQSPMKSVLIAAGVGLVLGSLCRR